MTENRRVVIKIEVKCFHPTIRVRVGGVLSFGQPAQEDWGRSSFTQILNFFPTFTWAVEGVAVFFGLAIYIYIYSQNEKTKIRTAKIKCFKRFSIAIIRPKFTKNRRIRITGSSRLAKNIIGCFLKKYFHN